MMMMMKSQRVQLSFNPVHHRPFRQQALSHQFLTSRPTLRPVFHVYMASRWSAQLRLTRPTRRPGTPSAKESVQTPSCWVVNNIYVPPLRALSSVVSRQVSAIIRRPVITPRVVLDPCAPSFHPRAI